MKVSKKSVFTQSCMTGGETVRFDSQIPARLHGAHEKIKRISFQSREWPENRFRVRLYRFMAEAIPVINAVIWTWSRLAAAPGRFRFYKDGETVENPQGDIVLEDLFRRINRNNFGHDGTPEDVLPPFFQSLFLDGSVAGQLTLRKDLSAVEIFRFFDTAATDIRITPVNGLIIRESSDTGERSYSGPDLFYYALNADLSNPCGSSVIRAIPFVSYVEQQLVDDMRRSAHNAGYHRLHVKIHPPEKREGESDESYISRANEYFDGTLSMIRDVEPEDNPVTWDDVAIEYIGPKGSGGTRASNWYLNHRAMVEEICSGTNLAPFLLGYSYNATTNWAQLKYDLVMRQVRSVQQAAIGFLNWLANIELALKGFNLAARWEFDNRLSALAKDQVEIKSRETACIIDLYTAGLIDRDTAIRRAAQLV